MVTSLGPYKVNPISDASISEARNDCTWLSNVNRYFNRSAIAAILYIQKNALHMIAWRHIVDRTRSQRGRQCSPPAPAAALCQSSRRNLSIPLSIPFGRVSRLRTRGIKLRHSSDKCAPAKAGKEGCAERGRGKRGWKAASGDWTFRTLATRAISSR